MPYTIVANLIQKSNTKLLIDLLKDPDRKSILKITAEIISLFYLYRCIPRHYFSRYLFKKDRTNIKDYFPNKFLYRIKTFFNDQGDKEVLENKLYFDFFYSQFNISIPKILMYNNKKIFVVDNSEREVNSVSDFKILLETIIRKTSTADSVIIKKTYGSYGGMSVYKIFLNQLATDPETIKNLYLEVTKSAFLFQETIKQHPEIDKLNPSSVNSIRFDTFIDQNGKADIISGYMRMSISNLCVDNISSGGCMVAIDLQTGKLKKYGFSLFNEIGMKILTEHPVTKVIFENLSIPFFEQAKELVIRTARLAPGLRLVGWDVAIGASGPILIEGNSNYDASGNDLSESGYRNNPVFRKILHEINYL